ncbi:hydroxyacid dehydrogenase [Chloroflexi bacterium TSY]|nr:hydroxyacid dehydrogenase [Chloroflexi bacterium TSY]
MMLSSPGGITAFIDDVLSAANRLRLIAHSAGSIKRMLPPNVFKKGIAVTHAATAIAPAVAEMTVLLILLCLRQAHKLDRILKDGGDWRGTKVLGMGQELAGARVGVVGAGHTGREVIWRLNALKADVWASDPYMSPERAKELGVTKVEMDDIFRDCPIVTMQAPPTEETYRMVGAKQLGLLRDGAIFVNTARSHTVDQDALLAELRTGRFQAALDVFDQEPLPTYSPFRQLDNVFITPHVAGASTQARLRQGELMVQELKSFFEDETLKWEVTLDMLDTMA